MATPWSGSPSPPAAAPASATEDGSKHWAPHGTILTACVVGINVLVILLIYFFFWRFFSGKPAGPSGGDEDDELPVASPWAFHLRRNNAPRRPPPQHQDVVASLPVYVYSSSAAGAGRDGGEKAAECTVCIVELRDGDAVRRLPRCGHRFHADCVAAWLRLHATCPLCRASIVAPAAAATEPVNASDAAVGADCRV